MLTGWIYKNYNCDKKEIDVEDLRYLNILVRKYLGDGAKEATIHLEEGVVTQDTLNAIRVITEDDVPPELTGAARFYWRQDHGLTSSSEDAFGF